jgi:hypothetical protein
MSSIRQLDEVVKTQLCCSVISTKRTDTAALTGILHHLVPAFLNLSAFCFPLLVDYEDNHTGY